MIDKSKQNTLKVCLEDVGAHNRAILDFFFAKLGQHVFRCVDTQEEANVLLIDYDFPPARQRFESEYQQWQKPALILSISEVSIENAIWLAKPLTSRALLDAAGVLQQQLANSPQMQTSANPSANLIFQQSSGQSFVATTRPVLQRPPIQELSAATSVPLVDKLDEKMAAESDVNTQHSPTDSGSETFSVDTAKGISSSETSVSASLVDQPPPLPAQSTVDEPPPLPTESEKNERNLLLCGNQQDLEASAELSDDFYKDDSFFLSSLKDAVRLARQCQQGVLLNFPDARIYVLPEIHRIFCGIDTQDSEFTELISACNVKDGGKMHILSTREIHELNDMISQQASALYDLESFVWTSTLLSAQGSLPRALDPGKSVGLKHWPSLTRLENFPHVLPIAAQWSASAMSAFDIAKSLNIPQRYAFSFYNAANSLGLIEQDPDKLINTQSAPRPKDAPRGLFSRLLKRLVGG